MIPVTETLEDFDTLEGEEIEFGIGDPRWVMKTQADLYSDITTAIIREYSTNAYDANVMAGNPDPITVTLPSAMSKFFVVEDKGVGMNLDLFRRIYTQFGVSDKRDSKATNGMLGYGSKSGVAYTTQFTVTSIKDGHKIVGVIKRKPDWRIVLKVATHTRTTEPNGTKVVIPVHNVDEFNHKAKEFYKFWQPGRVLVNGREPEHHVGDKITDNLYYSKDWGTSYVVMGNVAYRIANPEALFRNSKMNRLNFVAYVDEFDTGDDAQPVEFTPSREDLKYTDRTKSTLQAVIDNFASEIVDTAKAEIDAATTHAEAYKAWSKWTSTLGASMFSDLEFKGDKFKSDFTVHGHRYDARGYYNSTQAIRNWHVEQMDKTLVVTEFDINVSSSAKSRAKEYAKLKGISASYILFIGGSASSIVTPWVEKDERFVTWADLKEALPKKPKATPNYATGPRRIRGTFDFLTPTGSQYEQELPENQDNLFYITIKDSKTFDAKRILRQLGLTDGIVVLLGANRLNKFNRENPTVQDIVKYAQSKVVTDGPSLLSDDAKEVRNIDYTTRQWVRVLDHTRLDDPEFARLATLIKNEESLTAAYKSNLTLASFVGMRYNVREHNERDDESLFVKYPLLSHFNYHGKVQDHIYLYMNAAYAAEKENTNV